MTKQVASPINVPIKIKAYEDVCGICYEYWADVEIWVFPCGHMICEKCYLKQRKVNNNCHICREKFALKMQRKNKKTRRRKNFFGREEDFQE